MTPRIGIVTFPGTLDDIDAARAARLSGWEPVGLWHAANSLEAVDAVLLPGGFSYGDYLRAGAIARFAPLMGHVIAAAARGMPVLGICNGFQVLCEAKLLPGALISNAQQTFICREQRLRVETRDTVWSNQFDAGEEISIVVKNGAGAYMADEDTLQELEANDRVVLRYLDNPNGSLHDIAGITNERGNVVGMMPHPEHNVDPVVAPTTDGVRFFTSALQYLSVVA